ncbi:MAG: HAMP domain-containing sensor histidine kinase [Campylobacterota bacterium]|nr:HAMP domain-containing sensor histidine kinase [Campylobacterota bacterium]
MVIKLIERDIKRIRFKIVFSHLAVSIVLSLLLVLSYLFYQYSHTLSKTKNTMYEISYRVNEALVFESLEDIGINTSPIAIFDNNKKLVFGSLPFQIDLASYGFLRTKGYFFLISKPYDPALPRGYIVVTASMKPIWNNIIRLVKLYLPIILLLNLIYGFLVYLLSNVWTKPILKTYKNLEDSTNIFSHEVLTPISTALFYIDKEEVRENLMKAKDFVNNFLMFQKYQAFPWHKKDIDLEELTNVVLKELTPRIEEKNIEIKTDLKVRKIFSNPELVYLILKNTIENAVKFSPENERIELVSEIEGKGVLLEIMDKGSGFDEKISKKFESKSGFGLGLYITKKSIQSLGGRIDIHSKRGEGTTVKLHLPR